MATPDTSTKRCPDCCSLLVIDATLCAACGYEFKTADAEAPNSAQIVFKAEELFESHLRARMHRAMRELKAAKIDVLRAPQDPAKRARLRDVEKELELLESQLAVQAVRTEHARRAMEEPQQTPSAPSATATDAFKDAQAVKAREAFDFARLQMAAQHAASAETTAQFTAAQSEKAERIVKNAGGPKFCPGCSAQVTASAVRCHCGYVLTASATRNDEFLSEEELAALRKTT